VGEDAPLPFVTWSNVKMFDLDEENKAKANIMAHGIIVSLVGGTLHGRLIEEGNVSVTDKAALGKSTVHEILRQVCSAISNNFRHLIAWPARRRLAGVTTAF
jgi:hypothetical protein